MRKLGSMQCSVLWHLLDVGSATIKQVAALTGVKYTDSSRCIHTLIPQKLVQIATPQVARPAVVTGGETRGRKPKYYGLTKDGIERALTVDQNDVHFARDHKDVRATL